MSDLAAPSTPTAPTASLRAQNKLVQEIAAGIAPELAEAYFAAAMASSDIETKGKALDRAAKITGLTEDRGASSLPAINITFSGTAFQVGSVTPPKLQVLQDVTPRPLSSAAPADDPEPAWAAALLGTEDD